MLNARYKWRKFLGALLGFVAIFWANLAGAVKAPPVSNLCPNVQIEGAIDPGLSGAENRLVCGDPETDAWKTIPVPQAEFNLTNFLQQRGFFHPSFSVIGDPGERRLFVRTGLPTRVTKFAVEGAPAELKPERKRQVVGEILTPGLLSTVEKWVSQRLKAIGYPCPEVKAVGDPDTGEILAKIKTGPLQNLAEIRTQTIPGVNDGVPRRYDAFQMGHRFNGDNLDLTATRLEQNLFDSAYFLPECGPNGAIAKQYIVPGPPRTFSVGAGFDTEGLLLGKISWKNQRLGNRGSSVEADLFASTKEQHLLGLLNAYTLEDSSSRRSLAPSLEFWHQNQPAFETITNTATLAERTSWDGDGAGLTAQYGPQIQEIRTFRGPGPSMFHTINLDSSLTWMTHDFEFYRTNPRSGYSITGSVDFNNQNVFATVAAQRLGLRYEALWNLNSYDPPLWIFGVRGGANTTLTGERPVNGSTLLPPTYTYFLGGSLDVRGFGLMELPKSGIGGLTSSFADFEARLNSILPLGMQPFLFFDMGMLGTSPFHLAAPIYYSPGLGIRWDPGVGSIRTTVAHGYPNDIPGHWQFYFSFGEEF